MKGTAKDELQILASSEYSRRRKQYVEVITANKLDGSVVPKMVILADGREFEVEVYRDPIPAVFSDGEGRTIVYPIRKLDNCSANVSCTNASKSFLFQSEDHNRWYVLMKC